MIRNGLSNHQILENLKSKYTIKDSQAYSLIHQSIIDLQQVSGELNLEDIKAEYIERIENIFQKAINSGDLKTALKAQDMLNKINQLYVEKQELTVTNDIIKFKFDS